jgi:hypothetical protein
MAFDETAVFTVFDKVVSYCMTTNRFDFVNQHEPKSTPGTGVSCSVWVQTIGPVRTSGLAATSGLVVLQARIYMNFRSEPYDIIDPKVLAAAADIMGALSGDFNFGTAANVREVDLLGAYGPGLSAAAGYIEIDRQIFRVMTITVPIIINDMFTQTA